MTVGADPPAIKLDINTGLLRIDQCRHGVFLSLKSDNCIGRSLSAYGEWGEGEVNLLAHILRPGDIVIDAGANIGTHSIPFARIVGQQGRVYAFEPQPVVHQILSANVVLNGLSQISTINSGLSDANGWISFPELQYGADSNFGGVSLDMIGEVARTTKNPRRQNVPVARLDEILTLDRLRLLKADVEGMESALLRGARETLKRLKPALYLECREPSDASAIIKELEGLDYTCFWHVTQAFNPANWKGEARPDAQYLTEINMLCVPANIVVNGMTPATGADDHPRATSNATR